LKENERDGKPEQKSFKMEAQAQQVERDGKPEQKSFKMEAQAQQVNFLGIEHEIRSGWGRWMGPNDTFCKMGLVGYLLKMTFSLRPERGRT